MSTSKMSVGTRFNEYSFATNERGEWAGMVVPRIKTQDGSRQVNPPSRAELLSGTYRPDFNGPVFGRGKKGLAAAQAWSLAKNTEEFAQFAA